MWKTLFIISLFSLGITSDEQSSRLYHPFQSMITISVYNPNFWPVTFYSRALPCTETNHICARQNDEGCLEYKGIRGSYEHIYEVVMPFQSFVCTFDVTEGYDMSQPGNYSIEFRRFESSADHALDLETTLLVGSKDQNFGKSSKFSFLSSYLREANLLQSNRLYLEKLTYSEMTYDTQTY